VKQENLLMFREKVILNLKESIADNLERYRSGNFEHLNLETSNFLDTKVQFKLEACQRISCTVEDHNEVACTLASFEAFSDLTPYLARDERLWVYLTHIKLLDYSRKRWPIPEDETKAVSHILTHFFVAGARGIERDNAASRLWWMAFICSRVKEIPLEKALKVFLHLTDVRANIFERPNTSQNINVLSAVIHKLAESYDQDKALFERARFREMMKELNLRGGIKLLEVLDLSDVTRVVERCSRL